jgi:ribosomal protein S18 acetylase RimI-like enzyme
VPTLRSDIKDMFNRDKNGAYEYCDSIGVLAYKDKKVVGRLMGIINYRYNEKMNVKHLRFTLYDVIDDFEVTKAMFDYIIKWGKEQGMTEINGPLGFTDIDKQDMLIEGYDKIGMSITNYNYPYYVKHMEELGFIKDVDWVEYKVNIPNEIDPRLEKISSMLMNRRGYKLVEFKNKKEIKKRLYDIFDAYNKAFEPLHGVIPLTRAHMDAYYNQYISLLDLKYIKVVEDEQGKIVAVGILAPSLTEALQKNKGKLFPFGWIPLLKALKHPRILDMYIIGVMPEYQGLGINSIIMLDVLKQAIEDKIEFAETGPELVENEKVQAQWKGYDAKIVRRRRCWMKDI